MTDEERRIQELENALNRCHVLCTQGGLKPPNGEWARKEVIKTVEGVMHGNKD